MIQDKLLEVSNAQAITATALSTGSVDLGASRGDIGAGEKFDVFALVTEAFNNLTSLTFQFVQSANADLSSSDVITATGAIPLASLVAGYMPKIPAPPPGSITKRYVGLNYLVTGTAPTTGKVTAYIAGGVQRVSQTA